MSFAQMERMASIAESKLSYLVSQKRREPSLRAVLLHASFLERVLDKIDSYTPPAAEEDEPMIDDVVPAPVVESRPEVHSSLATIVEVDEMEVDEDDDSSSDDEDEDMPPLRRTVSHRPGSPTSSDEEDESDSDDDLPSPPPAYTPPQQQDHPLFNLFEVREKTRKDDLYELGNHYHIRPEEENMFLLNNSLAVAA